jgi:uncharacterized protein YhaN
MKLADQIALLKETLDELGVSPADGESTGECAAKGLKQAVVKVHELDGYVTALEESREAYIQRVAELEQNAPSTDGLCDSCQYLKDAAVPRVCMNPEAWRQGFSRRGYSVKQGHGCEEWSG